MPPAKHRNQDSMLTILRESGRFLDHNSDREITVNDLAIHCKCGVRFLNHSFSALLGCNARIFIQRYRAARLRSAIEKSPHKSINQLAEQCGMRLTPTARRVFLSIYGTSTDTYLEKCRAKSEINSIAAVKDDPVTASDLIEDAIRHNKIGQFSATSDPEKITDIQSSKSRRAS
jgi:AraC-like DNA-binding protein